MSNDKYREENGVIYFSVTSDGASGEEMYARLKRLGYKLPDFEWNNPHMGMGPLELFRSNKFVATKGKITEIAIVKEMPFKNGLDRSTVIYKVMQSSNFKEPDLETFALIREKFTDDELTAMGLNLGILVYTEAYGSVVPIVFNSNGLSQKARDNGWGDPIKSCYIGRESEIPTCYGFAFAVSQVSK